MTVEAGQRLLGVGEQQAGAQTTSIMRLFPPTLTGVRIDT